MLSNHCLWLPGPALAQNDACLAAPLPPSGDLPTSDNGVTYPPLLHSLVKAANDIRLFPDSKTIV